MNREKLTTEFINSCIPNRLATVANEASLADRLAPFIDDACRWLEREYLGPDDFLSEAHNELAMKIVVRQAFALAIPSLDLVITPSGFGVISTDSMAPASRDRVDRLIKSLNDYVEANMVLLIDICRTYPEWRDSERGRYFCSTFLYKPCGVMINDRHLPFPAVHDACLRIEAEMAQRYLGVAMMDKLRDDYHAGMINDSHHLVTAVIAAEMRLLEYVAEGRVVPRNAIWQASRSILFELKYFPVYRQLRDREMPEPEPFVNDVKGGFFF